MEADICSMYETFKFYFVNHPEVESMPIETLCSKTYREETVQCLICQLLFFFIFTHTNQINLIGPQQTCSLNYEHKETKTK